MSDEAESGELPIQHSPFDLREIGRRSNSSFLRTRKKDFLVLLDLNCIIFDLDFSSIRPKCRAMVMVDYLIGITSMTYVMTVNIFYGKCRACIYSSSS